VDNTPKPAGKALVCRLCKGGHFTAKCPYKDQLAAIDQVDMADADEADGPPRGGLGAASAGGKYVPP
jgi:translation initiation factor 3 subunit G